MSKFEIIFAKEALDNIENIIRFIAKDNYGHAVIYRDGIENIITGLPDNPYKGKQYGKRKSDRVCFYKNHKIHYRIIESKKLIRQC